MLQMIIPNTLSPKIKHKKTTCQNIALLPFQTKLAVIPISIVNQFDTVEGSIDVTDASGVTKSVLKKADILSSALILPLIDP